MSRNQNSRFSQVPTADINRSKFSRDSSYKTSFNVGQVIPFYCDEVLPGDTFQIKTSKVVRFQPMVTAPMDNVYFDTYYFFVPNRLVWDHWREFNGENTQSAWIPTVEYAIPQINAPAGGWNIGTLADYFGLPTGVEGISVSALPFRAYGLIMNEWFRDQNLMQPLHIPTDDTTVTGVNTGDYVTDVVLGGLPFVAAKYHDYFTSCLPSPQKGPDVTIGLSGDAPVLTQTERYVPNFDAPPTMTMYNGSTASVSGARLYPAWSFDTTEPGNYSENVSWQVDTAEAGSSTFTAAHQIFPDNLYASLGSTNVVSINQLRLAFQIQKLYEKDARGGTRYTEILRSHFGVVSPDARLQRPEYLGGNRIPININQVIQMSGTMDGTTPQGNVTGQSLTSDSHGDFIKSFTEHGYIIGICVSRYDHTYQQGIARHWSRKTRFDYYWPVLANIGEQAVLNKEIFAAGTAEDDEVFGYQEAWADYRYKPSIVTGEMRSDAATSLDVWHFADDYETCPALSAEWVQEDKSNIDRALAVTSSVSNQIFVDFFVENETTRPMPVYSVPGLIDHH